MASGSHEMTQRDPAEEQRRRSVRRTTILLALVALGIYVTFIVSSVMKAQP